MIRLAILFTRGPVFSMRKSQHDTTHLLACTACPRIPTVRLRLLLYARLVVCSIYPFPLLQTPLFQKGELSRKISEERAKRGGKVGIYLAKFLVLPWPFLEHKLWASKIKQTQYRAIIPIPYSLFPQGGLLTTDIITLYYLFFFFFLFPGTVRN